MNTTTTRGFQRAAKKMTTITPGSRTFFTSTTICFTIACAAFSLVAISAVWRNSHHHNSTVTAASESERDAHPVRPQPPQSRRRRRAVDSVYVTGEQQPESAQKNKYAQLSELVGLAGNVSQAIALWSTAPHLLGEISLLVGVLCRLQQEVLSEDNFLVKSAGSGACFNAATASIRESLTFARNALTEHRYSQADADRTAAQLRARRPVLEWLLEEVEVKSADGLETGKSTPTLFASPAYGDEEEHIGITPAIDEKCFIDPPPEYSPPAGSSSPVTGEKPDGKQESPSPAQTPKPFEPDSLFNAVNADDTGTLSQLLLLGADASTPFGDLRRTPLHIAAHLNHVQSLALLLKSGAVELSTEDAKGDTALHLAAWAGNVEALSLLLTHSTEVDFLSGRDGYSPLWCAISANQIDAARLLLKHGARVSLRSAGGCGLMPLHQAAVMGQSAMCELLLERGAQVDCLDEDQNTPLHYAAASGSVASVKVLLRGGASLEAKQNYGLTAVHWAAHKGHAEVIEVLLHCGAKVDCRANEGATPLHLAANRGHVAAAKMLLERGASRRPGSATWDGVSGTPAEMAKAKGHNRLVRLLRS